MSAASSGAAVSGRSPAKSSSSPAAARPTVPARYRPSPVRAPERRIAGPAPRAPASPVPSSTVPSAVIATTTRPEDERSPPMIGTWQPSSAPARPASARIPVNRASRSAIRVSSGRASDTSRPCGFAPMAQTSARFCAAALRPSSDQSTQSRVKSSFSTSMSAVDTSLPAGAVTAASSPGPTIT